MSDSAELANIPKHTPGKLKLTCRKKEKSLSCSLPINSLVISSPSLKKINKIGKKILISISSSTWITTDFFTEKSSNYLSSGILELLYFSKSGFGVKLQLNFLTSAGELLLQQIRFWRYGSSLFIFQLQ